MAYTLDMINQTLSRKVFEILREKILTGALKPEDRLLYVNLAQELDVSLSPVKEALVYLEQEGLVTIIPRKGAFVRRFDVKDIMEYTWIRHALESLAVERVCAAGAPSVEFARLREINRELAAAVENGDLAYCMHLDNEFHTGIVTMCHMNQLTEMLDKLPLRNLLAMQGSTNHMVDDGEHICRTHADIVDAMEAGDAQHAKELLKENMVDPIIDLMVPEIEEREAAERAEAEREPVVPGFSRFAPHTATHGAE